MDHHRLVPYRNLLPQWRLARDLGGEGGGVLVNQCPHQLDLFQWLFGMPTRVRAHARFGAYHDIK